MALPVVVSVCAMLVPEPAEAPLTPACVTVHENVVPATLLLNAIELALPEQMLCELGVAVADGTGFTVTEMVCAVPGQLPILEVGVTV